MFLFPCLLFPYFPPLRPREMGPFSLGGASSVSGTEGGGGGGVRLRVGSPCVCLKAASQLGSIQNNIQQASRFIRRSVVRGSTLVPAHFPSHSPLFTPFNTWTNAYYGKKKKNLP